MKKKLIIIICSIVVLCAAIFLFFFLKKKLAVYSVTFETEGGSYVASQKVDNGENINIPSEPVKEGYIFIGWTYQGKIYDFSSKPSSNITLKAEWKKIDENVESFIVKFNSDGGTTFANQVIEKGNKVTKPSNPTKKGYKFVEWLYNGETYDFDKEVLTDLELVATWKKEETKKDSNSTSSASKIASPKLKNMSLTACGSAPECSPFIPNLENGKYTYDLGIIASDSKLSGFELYIKSNSKYTKVTSGNMDSAAGILVNVEPGEKKIYVARVYKTNASGTKEYSDYSNEITIDHSSLKTPTLRNVSSTACGAPTCPAPQLVDGKYSYDLGIDSSDYRKILGGITKISVSGYEVYEKNGSTYTKVFGGAIGNPELDLVSVNPGEKKIYVARVYAIKADGTKIYSNYSNEIVIDHSNSSNGGTTDHGNSSNGGTTEPSNEPSNVVAPAAPTLKNMSLTACGSAPECNPFIPNLENGKYSYDLGILASDSNLSGYELYTKSGSEYTKVTSGNMDSAAGILVNVEVGENKVYAARVYKTNASGNKVYSNYSNEITIDHSSLKTPTLRNVSSTACGAPTCPAPQLVDGKYSYDLGIDSSDYRKILGGITKISVSGYEVYEKNGSTYTKVFGGAIGNPELDLVSVNPGEKKIYVARVYAIKADGTKIYSNYSNEIVIDHTN